MTETHEHGRPERSRSTPQQFTVLRYLSGDLEEMLTTCPAPRLEEFECMFADWLQTFAAQLELEDGTRLIVRDTPEEPTAQERWQGTVAERYYIVCQAEDGSGEWRFYRMTDEEYSHVRAGIAMALANVYDADYEDRSQGHARILDDRLSALRHDRDWRARLQAQCNA